MKNLLDHPDGYFSYSSSRGVRQPSWNREPERGFALFPKQEGAGLNWALEAVVDTSPERLMELEVSGQYYKVRRIPLTSLLPGSRDQIDLLHVDIQGAEGPLLPASIDFMNERVRFVLVGTHSSQIEGTLFESLLHAGWVLEVERPASLAKGRTSRPIVDGLQLWRNPSLLEDVAVPAVPPSGLVEVLEIPCRVAVDELFDLRVRVANNSDARWISQRVERPVRLSYHWLRTDGALLHFEGLRSDFSASFLDSGAETIQSMRVAAPPIAGTARLMVTVVHEWIRWFDEPGFRCHTVEIDLVVS